MRTGAPGRLGLLAAAAVAAVGVLAFFTGFYLMPSPGGGATVWGRLCSAAGIVQPRGLQLKLMAPATFTHVVVSQGAPALGSMNQAGRGATLALRCTICHGAEGVSGADAPNLAGQYPEVLYKQLVDFKRGARTDAVMAAMVSTLTDEEMLDLSRFYARLPPSKERSLAQAPALVRVGDPMRNIAPCVSCHGRGSGKVGAPALEGEPEAYLEKQLAAFVDGSRKNDMNAAMRNEAHLLSAADITALSDHYAQSSR